MTGVRSNLRECVNFDGAVISTRLRREATNCFNGFGDQYAYYRRHQSFVLFFRPAAPK